MTAAVSIAALVAAGLIVAYYLWHRSRPSPARHAPDSAATFSAAINNTLALMAYAARTGKPLTEADVAAVVAAKRAGNAVTQAEEQAFWPAASSISKAVAPVTVDSIMASSPSPSGGKSKAEKAAITYMALTLVTLAALLVCQIHWLIGATIVGELKENRVQLEKLSAEGLAGDSARAALNSKAKDYRAQKRLSDAAFEQWRTRLSVQQISAHSNFKQLRDWNRGLLPGIHLGRLQPSQPNPSTKPAEPSDTTYFLWEFTPENVMAQARAEVKLAAMLKYLLPFLYGLLGACAYIVRTVANEIRDSTYSIRSSARYQLRFYLGAVAGLSIAWFTSDTKASGSAGMLQSLSPLALAFLAGYSVDLLFALLDRLVTAFSGPEPKTSS
jgi:hypothetical protein